MRRSSLHTGSSLAVAAVFLACIVLLILGGLLLKFFLILRASGFDGVHQYIVSVRQDKSHAEIIAFSPSTQSVEALRITGTANVSDNVYVHIPVDARLTMPLVSNVPNLVGNMLLHAEDEQGITILDKIRLLLFVNSLRPTDIHQTSITIPTDTVAMDRLVSGMFLDNALYADNKTITVVNATGVPGVAADAAKMLSTVGMDVVSVTTADANQNHTSIVVGHVGGYTASRLSHFFGVAPTVGTGSVVSDITLTIGKDSLPQVE